MFNDDNKKMAPKQGYHSQSQRFASRIHFTVTPIENLASWKAEQAEKEAQWEAGRTERYMTARERAVKMLGDTWEAERLRKAALKEQNKLNAGKMLDQIKADAPVRAEAAKSFVDGKYVYAPQSIKQEYTSKGIKAWLKGLFK